MFCCGSTYESETDVLKSCSMQRSNEECDTVTKIMGVLPKTTLKGWDLVMTPAIRDLS